MPAYAWMGRLRAPLRRMAFTVMSQLLATDDGKRIVSDALRGVTSAPRLPAAAGLPYRDLAAASEGSASRPVFVTARFRTGSTALWNLFRHVDGCRAFYEPLNERRWFDPARRGDRTDSTHRGVDDYWREYQGLESLSRHFRERWATSGFYMPETAWDAELYAYIAALIDAGGGRAVLQFNRVDFRLGWLRQNFPHATVVHLYRHPRDQWCSTLLGRRDVSTTATIDDFAPFDYFYLTCWARDLSYQFPFLDPRDVRHPYELFYYLWRLSFDFARRYADYSIGFERLCAEPAVEIPRLMNAAGVTSFDTAALSALLTPPESTWQAYASADWFEGHEQRCEAVLSRYPRAVAADRLPAADLCRRVG